MIKKIRISFLMRPGIKRDFVGSSHHYFKAPTRQKSALLILLTFFISLSSISVTVAANDKPESADDSAQPSETFHQYKQSAEGGESAAQYTLGEIYAKGKGVPQNHNEALKWYRRAAEQGHPGGEFMLGRSYAKGFGVSRDKVEAVNWYRKAADHGHAGGQYMVAMMYTLGLVGRRDYVEAIKWHRKAADQGHGKAQLMLGKMYTYGAGVPIDYVHAYLWLNLASVAGVKGASEAHELISLSMSAEQFEQAEYLSQEWWARHPEVE
jgi:uncharacterized protein